MKKILLLITMLSAVLSAQNKPDNTPKFSGYIRSWFQSNFSTNQGEFLIREARFSAKGNVNEYAGYKFQVDFARLGNFQTSSDTINGKNVLTKASANFSEILLDAEAIITPMENLSFSLGQSKVPFSTDNIRAGSDIDFSNRPLLTNISPGMYDIGFIGSYSIKEFFPVEFKAGLFNGTGNNKSEDDKTTNFSLRTYIQPIEMLGFSANYYGGKMTGAKVNIMDFGSDIKIDKLFISGEYGQRLSNLKNKKTTSNSYFIYTTYDFNFGDSFISHVMPALRYENYDANTSLSKDEVSRITTGVAFQFAKVKYAQLRINYELFNYRDGRSNPDKLILELQTRF